MGLSCGRPKIAARTPLCTVSGAYVCDFKAEPRRENVPIERTVFAVLMITFSTSCSPDCKLGRRKQNNTIIPQPILVEINMGKKKGRKEKWRKEMWAGGNACIPWCDEIKQISHIAQHTLTLAQALWCAYVPHSSYRRILQDMHYFNPENVHQKVQQQSSRGDGQTDIHHTVSQSAW